jgi:hypothetical protein
MSSLQDAANNLNAQLAISVANSTLTNANKQQLYNDIMASKNTDITQTHDSLLAQSNAIHGLYYYQQKNSQLNDVNQSLLGTTTGQATVLKSDSDLAKRQNEINEWETGNKMDTLFVYQQFLIILCATVIISYLWKMGIVSTTVFATLLAILVLIFIFTVVNRAQYTNLKRDTRYWNRRQFPTTGISTSGTCSTSSTAPSSSNFGGIGDLGGFGATNTTGI